MIAKRSIWRRSEARKDKFINKRRGVGTRPARGTLGAEPIRYVVTRRVRRVPGLHGEARGPLPLASTYVS